MNPIDVVLLLIGAVAGVILGFFVGSSLAKAKVEKKLRSVKQDAESILKQAEKEAEEIKRKAIIESREEVHRLREEFEKETRKRSEELKQRESELKALENRLLKREELLDRKEENLEKQRELLESKLRTAEEKEKLAEAKLVELAGMTVEDAKEIVLKRAEEKYEQEIAQIFKEIKDRFEDEAERKAKWAISLAIQRYAGDYTGEVTVSTVSLPSDDMKGRIIGREGRNIRTFEKLTGADLIIDDTPEVVTISCFHPLRREIARLTLEKLVLDGRIHPPRIEEMYEKAKEEIEKQIKEAGEEALYILGIARMHPELVKLIGRLKFRTSYGQNVLQHSIEMARIGALMASELDLDVELVKRACLLHDIGKAVDHEVEGSHALIGAELAKRYGEKPEVINAIKSHHGEEEPMTPEAVIVAAADAISASRPGARRETLELYIKRLQKLEEIAMRFKHVEKAYAVQAGREVRVVVEPDKVDDATADWLAHEIAKQIEQEAQYPGVLKVTVIRERRSTAYAS
ncbi:MAG TPA: ribonuclease Y [Thermotogae bacterium]|nr:ribonuclease Y [Thermotogota bacterium]